MFEHRGYIKTSRIKFMLAFEISGVIYHARSSYVKHKINCLYRKLNMSNNICKNPHRYNPHFQLLPENQGKEGRHKCAGCAYDLGLFHAVNGIPKATNDSVLTTIPFSQAGTIRHRDAFTAYQEGYDFAISVAMKLAA